MRNRRALGLGVAVLTGGLAVVVATRAAAGREPGAASRPRRPTPWPRPRRPGRSRRSGPSRRRPSTTAPTSSPRRRPRSRRRRSRTSPRRGRSPASTSSATRSNAKKPMQTFEEIMKEDIADEAQGHGGAAEAAREPLQPRAEARPRGQDVARQAARRRPDRPAGRGDDLGQAGRDDARARSARRARSPTRRCRTPSTRPAARSSRRCRSRCSRGWSGSTSTSTCPRRSCPSSRRPSSCRTAPSWATSRAARSSRSTTSTALFKDILTPVQLDGLRLLLTPLPQEEFNPTDDRKTVNAEPGRDLLRLPRQRPHDRPVPPQPRHPPAAAPLPARHDEPARRCSTSRSTASKRSLRSVEDFTEFEQRTAYFNGDPIHAMKKGFIELDRGPRHAHGPDAEHARLPAGPEADRDWAGSTRPRRPRASCAARSCSSARRQCAVCHPAPFYLDHQMHDLHLERFLNEPRRRADQDLHPARHQGQPALPARRPLPDAGGHRRVLQPGARD